MAKPRPAGSSKTELKRDPQEAEAVQAPPAPPAGPAESSGTQSKAVAADSPVPTQSGSRAESVGGLNGSRPPNPAAHIPAALNTTNTTPLAEAKPDPKPNTESRPVALAKPVPAIKRSGETDTA